MNIIHKRKTEMEEQQGDVRSALRSLDRNSQFHPSGVKEAAVATKTRRRPTLGERLPGTEGAGDRVAPVGGVGRCSRNCPARLGLSDCSGAYTV